VRRGSLLGFGWGMLRVWFMGVFGIAFNLRLVVGLSRIC
jgi:hypothetical protein